MKLRKGEHVDGDEKYTCEAFQDAKIQNWCSMNDQKKLT